MEETAQISLKDMIGFARLMLQFQDVERAFRPPFRKTKENDVEHSYQLAMMSWYLNSVGKLGYDTDRLIRYALTHDLAEALVGDVHAFDEAARQGKAERESEALDRIEAAHPAAREMVECAREYERQSNPEAKFIYALDKLMPMLWNYLDGGSNWLEDGFTFEALHANKLEKTAGSPPVKELYDQLADLLAKNPQLFPDKQP